MKTQNSKSKINKSIPLSYVLCLTSFILILFPFKNANAFCGFYVAKADATLFNKTSQVILVRDGDKTTITMSSDFDGNVKDFAMVIPVPVILKRDNIRTIPSQIFQTLDNYSSPRLTEYYDENPCESRVLYEYDAVSKMSLESVAASGMEKDEEKYKVKIEAQYTVDEYDILILSASESSGLERWLTDNGYKIPAGAREVLQPYINSNMKFFVVKVNMEELEKKQTKFLSPLQINFNSPKFMLPIRLGMANAKGAQDMIVYAFTKSGRVEATNYRTVKVPTDTKIPEFVSGCFGKFYVDTYRKHREEAGENNVYLEYAWNISGSVTQFCDPCNGPPPMLQDLVTAGVGWVNQYHYGYSGDVFFTRLHITYDRKNFPQDLIFEETPNRENFQARYVITHPAYGEFTCDAGRKYVKEVMSRRNDELNNLAILTGWDITQYSDYNKKFAQFIPAHEPRMRSTKTNAPDNLDNDNKQDEIISNDNNIKQESFGVPYLNDNSNPPSGNSDLKILSISVMVLLMLMAMVAQLGKRKVVAHKNN
ncbi:MAG: DUF2330 domain-containing protein [Chitinophagales bacterium]|nr:DUF2330 domain-containing protein [Chitinophagales bacterium]